MSRLDSRAYDWFAVITPPQKELAVQCILDREGFATFVPVRREWRYANKVARLRKQKREVVYALMPRYVFVGMSEGTPGWERVVCFREQISGILGIAGRPSRIPEPPLRDLMLRHSRGQFNAPGYQRYMATRREFAEGDRVLTDDGLFEGRVVEISGNMAKVFIELFGGSREVDVPLEKLVAAE